MKLPQFLVGLSPDGGSGGMGRDAFYLAVERAASLIVGSAVSMAMIHHLGPTRFGVLSWASALVAVIMPLAMLGLASPVTKLVLAAPDRASSVLATAVRLRLVASAAAFAVVAGIAFFPRGADASVPAGSTAVLLVLALQYFVQVLDTYESYNQASGKLVSTARARMVALAIGSAARLAAIWADAGVIVFAWLVVAQLAINLGWIAFGARALPDVRGGSFDRTQARRLLSMGAMLAIASGLNVLQARVEILLLERLLGLDAVGVYSAALRLVEVVDSVGVVAVTVYLPRLLGAASAGRLDDEHLVRSYRLAFVLYLACVPALAGLALIGWLFLSGRFPDVHWLVLALAPRPLLAFLGLTRSMHMLADEQLRYGVACALAGLVVGTALAMATIPVFGIPGAVLSGLASFVVSNVLIDAFFNRRYFRALARSLGMA